MVPPSSRARSRLMDRPRPVPPYRRLVVPSACWNASKISESLSSEMPIPVSVTEKAITRRAVASAGTSKKACCGAGPMRSVTEPLSVNFTALESRLRRICCSRCASVTSELRQVVGDLDLQPEALLLGLRHERLLHVRADVGEADLGRLDVHPAGLDLGQVEDVVDEPQQVRAGAVDGPGELDLLRGQVLLRVLGEQPGQQQQRVQRGTQLVAHVRQELRLVRRGAAELLRLLLEAEPGELDLAVLDLDVALLLGEQLGLLLQFGVGALQLGRLLLHLLGQPLRLGQQLLRTPVGLDRVEGDADGEHQPLEEGQVQLGEGGDATRTRSRRAARPRRAPGSTTRSVGGVAISPERMRQRSRLAAAA